MSNRNPGPKSLLGLRSLQRFRNAPMSYLTELANEYGDIAFFSLGPIQAALVNSPALVREILVHQIDDFPKVGQQRKVIRSIDGNSLFVKTGREWLADRRVVQAMFHPSRVSEYVDKMVALVNRRTTSWVDDSVLNFEDEMIELSIMIMGRVFFDTDLDARAEVLRAAVYERSKLFMKEMRALVPIPDSWPLPSKRKKKWLIKMMDDLIYGIIDRKRAEGLVGNDLITSLLRTVENTHEGNHQVRDHANMMFQAGADDVSTALVWLFYLIAGHPEAQEKIRNEIDRTVGSRDLKVADLPKFEFLDWVVKESLRLYPATWLFTARKAKQDVRVGNHVIEHRTWVFVSPYVTQRDSRFFEQPEEFIPERFSPVSGKPFHKHAYFPFGMGPRACAASNLAMMKLALLAATVLQRFQLELEPGQEKIEPEPLVTVRPKTGVQIRLRRKAVSRVRAA